MGLAVAATAGLVAAWPFRFGDPRFALADDFFYYLVPAQHFLATGQFAFFPGMATNGFHPLWMALIVALLKLAGGVGLLFYALLAALQAGLAAATIYQSARLAETLGATPRAAQAAALLSFTLALLIGMQGMEVALVMPLLLALLTRLAASPPVAPAHWSRLGLLGALVGLARLDTLVLLAPLALGTGMQARPGPRAMGAVALGALPLFAYFLLNRFTMGLWLPVSGLAKQLKTGLALSFEPLRVLFVTSGPVVLCFVFVCAVFLLLASVARCPAGAPRGHGLFRPYIIGLGVFYLLPCMLSDWPLWFWYLYPLVAVPPLAAARLCRAGGPEMLLQGLGAVVVCLYLVLSYQLSRPASSGIWQETLAMQPFVQAHPGRYAMGDRAGAAGALLPVPLLQLEGLMGERTFLETIRARTPLRDVLKQYAIDYYITAEPLIEGACARFREPVRAGAASPVMEGQSCEPPVFHSRAWPPVWIYRAADIR